MIDALNTFLAVVTQGSFSKVAKSQDLAVSSVARKIDWLEREIGAPLFSRSTRVLRLTDAGELFMPRARSILAELAEARDSIASADAAPRGVLTVTAPAAFGRRHVAPAIAAFLKHYPLLEVDLHLSDAVIDIAAERVDVAIRIGVLPDSDLLATRLAPQRRIACASPDYLERHGTPAHPEDLLRHNCLTLRGAPHRVGWWCFRGVNQGKPLTIHGSLRSDDSDALLHAAIAGLGIAHLATWLIAEEVAAGRLATLFTDQPVGEPLTGSAIHAVRTPGRAASKARLLIDFLRDYFDVASGAQPYWERAFSPQPNPLRQFR